MSREEDVERIGLIFDEEEHMYDHYYVVLVMRRDYQKGDLFYFAAVTDIGIEFRYLNIMEATVFLKVSDASELADEIESKYSEYIAGVAAVPRFVFGRYPKMGIR